MAKLFRFLVVYGLSLLIVWALCKFVLSLNLAWWQLLWISFVFILVLSGVFVFLGWGTVLAIAFGFQVKDKAAEKKRLKEALKRPEDDPRNMPGYYGDHNLRKPSFFTVLLARGLLIPLILTVIGLIMVIWALIDATSLQMFLHNVLDWLSMPVR